MKQLLSVLAGIVVGIVIGFGIALLVAKTQAPAPPDRHQAFDAAHQRYIEGVADFEYSLNDAFNKAGTLYDGEGIVDAPGYFDLLVMWEQRNDEADAVGLPAIDFEYVEAFRRYPGVTAR